MQGDTDILRELYMLTGKVNKDKNYLYYLLVKDGTAFKEEKTSKAAPIAKDSVGTFTDWFNEL